MTEAIVAPLSQRQLKAFLRFAKGHQKMFLGDL
jgi:hypothetical protein